jgi:hypothetical protein
MLVTNHVLCGGILGRALAHHPGAAFVAGVASHFVMDACPHWGKDPDPAQFLRVARRDGLAGIAVMALVAATAPSVARRGVLTGMIGAALVDLDKPCRHFFGANPFPSWLQRAHNAIQREAPHRMRRELAVAGSLVAVNCMCLVADQVAGRRHR